ncbi:MAG: LptF/LptG family permease [Candidatus Hatepunaea meridiana]|nr:LptF/LptG family permease [Candidatus Hatepunaea meridiana]
MFSSFAIRYSSFLSGFILILAGYILKEHIAPFIYGLTLIVFIFMMNLVFQMLGRVAGKGISIWVILEYFSLNLAWIIALAVPMAVLIATLSAFGRLSGDGEITALRSSGISPTRLMRPVMVAAFIITIGIGLFNNYLLPRMNHRTKVLLNDISRKKPTVSIDPGIFSFSIPKYVLRAVEVDQMAGYMKDISIFDNHEPDRSSTITAMEGQLRFVEEEERILMMLNDGEIHRQSKDDPDVYEVTSFDSALFRVEAPGMVMKRGSSGYRGERELSAGEMLQRVNKMKEKGGVHNKRRIAAYMVEIHKKFSIPAACIIFVLIGTPLGVMAHKGGLGLSGGISLLFFVIYWAFLDNGEILADRGHISPVVAMWSPNVLLGFVGIWLLWLAKRRTTLPAVEWIANQVSRLFKKK